MTPAIPPENFIDLLLDAVCAVDRDGYVRYVSAASERVFGYLPEEMIGRLILDFVHPDDLQRTQQAVDEILQGDIKPAFENRYVRKDGSVAHIMWSARWSEDDQIRVAVARDVTLRKRAEAMQSAMYAIAEAANSSDSLQAMLFRIHRVVDRLLTAPTFTVALEDPESGELNVHYNGSQPGVEPPVPGPETIELFRQVVRSGTAVVETADRDRAGRVSVPLTATDGVFGAISATREGAFGCFTNEDRELLEFVAVQISAAVERKQMQSQLEYMASYDQLTGLPNRHVVLDRIESALARAAREGGFLAILYLDLDRFKEVNDTYGHGVGDDVLRTMADRLNRCVRAADTVGRLGGDEFIVLLDTINHPDDAASVAEKMNATLSQPYDLSPDSLTLTPSIGIATYPDHGTDSEALIRYADNAMYRAKKATAVS